MLAVSVSMRPSTHMVIDTGILLCISSSRKLSKKPWSACLLALYLCVHVCVYVCRPTCMYSCVCVCVCVCVRMRLCVYMCLCVFMYAYVVVCVCSTLQLSGARSCPRPRRPQ
jgi:hypothetical protein